MANENRTLDEIKDLHEDNFDYVMKKCTVKSFPSAVYAYQYRMHCMEKAMRDLGSFSPQDLIISSTGTGVAIDLIDQAMQSKGIRVEDWSGHDDVDKRGLYLYKDDEIAFFIAMIKKSGDNYLIKTNVEF